MGRKHSWPPARELLHTLQQPSPTTSRICRAPHCAPSLAGRGGSHGTAITPPITITAARGSSPALPFEHSRFKNLQSAFEPGPVPCFARTLQAEQLPCRKSPTLPAAWGAEHPSPPQFIHGFSLASKTQRGKKKRRTRTGFLSESDRHQENNLKTRIGTRSSPTASAGQRESHSSPGHPPMAQTRTHRELPPAFEAPSFAAI